MRILPPQGESGSFERVGRDMSEEKLFGVLLALFQHGFPQFPRQLQGLYRWRVEQQPHDFIEWDDLVPEIRERQERPFVVPVPYVDSL
jgi:hypothetical protein